MRLLLLLSALGVACLASRLEARDTTRVIEPRQVLFASQDGGTVHGDLYGSGKRGLVLAHGGRRTKEHWRPQVPAFVAAGFRVLAFDFRGVGQSTAGARGQDATHLDVLAAVDYLRREGATTVAVIGGSFGGVSAAAATVAAPDAINRLVLLGATPEPPAERLVTRTLYIATREDANAAGLRLPGLQAHVANAPQPKELIVLPGSAHAQFMFESEHGPRVMREILRFLADH